MSVARRRRCAPLHVASFFTTCPTKPTVNELKFSCKLAAQQPQLMSARKPHPQRKGERGETERETHTDERGSDAALCCALPMFLFVCAKESERTDSDPRVVLALLALSLRAHSRAHSHILSLLLLKCLSCCCSCRQRERER